MSGSAGCIPCFAGKYLATHEEAWYHDSAADCIEVPEGHYSGVGAEAPIQCMPGTFSSNLSSTSCLPCEPGKFSGQKQSISCANCEIGYFSNITGTDRCESCGLDPRYGYKYSSDAGATSCGSCTAGNFWDDSTRRPRYAVGTECSECSRGTATGLEDCWTCPEPGTECTEPGVQLSTLKMAEGWFRFTEKSTQVYECPGGENTCAGGIGVGDALCKPGAYGPLCSLCKSQGVVAGSRDEDGSLNASEYRFYLDYENLECQKCQKEDMDNAMSITLVLVLVLSVVPLLLVGTCIVVHKKAFNAKMMMFADWMARNEDSIRKLQGEGNVVFICIQTIVLLRANHINAGGSAMNSVFEHYIDWFEPLALNLESAFPILACFWRPREYLEYLHGVLFAAVVVVLSAWVYAIKTGDPNHFTHLRNGVTLVQFFSPAIARIFFGVFRCRVWYEGTNPESFGEFRYQSTDYRGLCKRQGGGGGAAAEHFV